MDLQLKDRVAIVTGAGRGIGKAISLFFAQEGVHVVINDIDLSLAEKVAKEAEGYGSQGIPFKADITRFDDVKQMADAVLQRFGRIDILVNNAGVGDQRKLFTEMEISDWDRVIRLCLYGTLHCNRAVVDAMIKQQSGKIVSIVSDAGRIGEPRMTIYSAAKAAIIGHSKALAKEVGQYKINVNVVSPASTETETTLARRTALALQDPKLAEKRLKAQLKLYPLGRFGQPQDIAHAVAFLVSEKASFITGEVISVNGGYAMVS